MNGFESILAWITSHVKMHEKRQQTLAYLVEAAMLVRGMGVLALGRAVNSETSAKHSIKRVWRFLRNSRLECASVHRALFEQFAPSSGAITVLVDWTDFAPYTQLVFALPRDGRALPFLSKTIVKQGEGEHIATETWALEQLKALCGGRQIILVADRGFGNHRWMNAAQRHGWSFVQRVAKSFGVSVEEYVGRLDEMRPRRRQRARDLGWGDIGEKDAVHARLVVHYAPGYDEPWYLVTNMDAVPSEIVRHYQRRMWIEAMFRDWKNKRWGFGMREINLSTPDRYDRLFVILALAYVFMTACGAYGEKTGLGNKLKANTVRERVMTLIRIGMQILRRKPPTRTQALNALQALPI
jgi:hypothetical protein